MWRHDGYRYTAMVWQLLLLILLSLLLLSIFLVLLLLKLMMRIDAGVEVRQVWVHCNGVALVVVVVVDVGGVAVVEVDEDRRWCGGTTGMGTLRWCGSCCCCC